MNHLFQQPVRLFLFAALMAAAATGHALPTISMNPVPAEKKITLTIDGLKECATILLQDENGEVLLREITKKEEASFAKIINLSQLAAGNYFLRVKTSLKEVVQPFELTNSEAIIQASKQKEFFAPIIKSSGDYVDISFFNGKAGNVEIAIFDQKGELVFQEALQNVVIVQKRYNVNNLRRGDYTFRVSTAEQSHFHPFSLAK